MRGDELRVWKSASVVLGGISVLFGVWTFLIQPYRDESRATETHIRELVAAELRVREVEGRGLVSDLAALQRRVDAMATDLAAVKQAVAVVEERTRFLEEFVRTRKVAGVREPGAVAGEPP